MTSYTDVFGGSTVQAADVQFRAVALAASIVTVWPAFASTGNECARIMKVTPSAGSLTVTLPDATLTSAGMDVLFDNPSATTFTVLDSAGGTVATVAGGEVKYFYLSDSSTAAGTWRVTLFGVGASNVDAGQLAGYGLTALSSTLNIAAPVTQISSNTTVTTADRSKVFVWTGGSGTLTLPSTVGSTSNYAIEVHNQGTGTLTVATTGGALVDGSATIALIVNESCFIHMGSTDWYTVGRGRNTQFNFTQLNKVVTGGTVNLTLTEASNVVQTFTGTLLSNQVVNQPAVVQVYYVNNATSGAYTMTFGCVAGGTTVAVVQGQAAILFCDGTNIINANTSLSGGISSIVFAAGSAAVPSASFATSDTGFYSTGTDEIGVSNNGVYSGKFTTGGFKTEVAVAAAVQAVSSGAAALLAADRPAGNVGSVRLRTAGTDRWSIEETATAESGANAGSNLALNAYSDAGALLGTALTAVRSTQVATFTQPPVLVGTNITGVPISTGISGLGANVATFLATPSSANLAAALTDETGTGANVFANSPTLVTPALGTPSALVGTNITGTAAGLTAGSVTTNANLTGAVTSVGNATSLGSFTSAQLATALTDETGSGANVFATSPTLVTPNIGVATGTSFQGIIGNVTPAAGTFTTLTSTGNSALGDAEASDTHAIKGATTLLANSSSAALTVTQTGAGNAFVVEDSASTDSTPFVIDAGGRAITGYTASVPVLGVDAGIQNWASLGYMSSGRFSADAFSAWTTFVKSRNATVGGQTIVQSGDDLGNIAFTGSDGTGFIQGARITAAIDGTPGTNDMPGRLVFSTTADGASSPTERMRIDSEGNVGIGAASTLGYTIWNAKNMTGGSTTVGQINVGTIQSDCTANASMYMAQPSTAAASFTLPLLVYYNTYQSTFGAGSAVTSQIGFRAQASMIGATTNYAFQADNTAAVTSGKTAYGFYSAVNAATGGGTTYGFYAAGTAANYFAGAMGFGATPSAVISALFSKQITGGTTAYGIYTDSSVDGSAVTATAAYFQTSASTSAGSTTSLSHYAAAQGTLTGSVTSQFGARVGSTLTGAVNNYGFYSDIANAANRYNFYAAGTADNYFAGNTGVGAAPTYRLDVTGIVANVAAFRRSGGQAAYFYIDTTDVYIGSDSAVTNSIKFTPGSNALALLTNNASRLSIDSAGAVTIGGTLTANGQTVGYLNIPQNSQSAPYTLVIGDAGKHILHPSADTTARTITIPANSSVAFPIGTAVTFVNQASAGVMTIAITTDTMRLAGAGTTGSRTLAANGVATAIKLTSTEWIISGTNLT